MKCTYSYIKITLIQVELRPFFQIFIKFNSKQNVSKLHQAFFPYEIPEKCLHLVGCAGHLTKILLYTSGLVSPQERLLYT